MPKIMICGIGTNVGKTVVSAILTTLFNGDYWKPIESGVETQSDLYEIQRLLQPNQHKIFPPSYSFQACLSPHHAAALENVCIDYRTIIPPHTERPLIIEGVGGILVPLTTDTTSLGLFKTWDCQWILVSQNYLGSINHTLMTIEVLKNHGISMTGIVFNGESNSHSESAILAISKLPFLARLYSEPFINSETIQRYAEVWKSQLAHIIC